jgi:transposase
MGIHKTLSSSTEPHTGRPHADLRKVMNGILYVVTTGCTWKDVPHKYDSKSKETLGRPVNRPSKVTTDAMYDPKDIRKYTEKEEVSPIFQ